MPTNYRKQMDEIIENIRAAGQRTVKTSGSESNKEPDPGVWRRPSLLMHVCCAPCSSSCLVQVRDDFDITAFFYNPNITERDEYEKRLAEEKRLILELNSRFEGRYDGVVSACGNGAVSEKYAVSEHGVNGADAKTANEMRVIEGRYEPETFLALAKGHEQDPEGGERCQTCFELRLRETARVAAEQGFDFFTTSLTLSPLKNAALLNEIGEKAGAEAGVRFLPSDFKKKDGYLLSLNLSKEHNLYRQDYCGCIYSKAERDRQKKQIYHKADDRQKNPK